MYTSSLGLNVLKERLGDARPWQAVLHSLEPEESGVSMALPQCSQILVERYAQEGGLYVTVG